MTRLSRAAIVSTVYVIVVLACGALASTLLELDSGPEGPAARFMFSSCALAWPAFFVVEWARAKGLDQRGERRRLGIILALAGALWLVATEVRIASAMEDIAAIRASLGVRAQKTDALWKE